MAAKMDPIARLDDTLKPLKAIIHGPPASGKTTVAKRICRRYGAHYVSVKTMIEETLEELTQKIASVKERALEKLDKGVEDEEVEEEEEELEGDVMGDDADIRGYEEQIRDITMLMSQSENHKLPDDYVVRLMRMFLAKEICETHGYVLDGYPKTLLQAKELFGQAAELPKEAPETPTEAVRPEEVPGEGTSGTKIGEMTGNASVNIMPDFVVSLQANDDFLCERIMKLPEKEVRGTHYEEERMVKRLLEFGENNTPDNNVLNFFDEAGIHPIFIDIADTKNIDGTDCILKYLYGIFGPPIPGMGLTDQEEEELRKLEEEERKLKQQQYIIEKKLAEERSKKEYEEKMEKWAETLEKLQMEEEKVIAAESEPLRFYLMKYVFPTLTRGLAEIAKIKPEDPIDYLAEYLFQENPEGHMFDPSYTRAGEEVLKQYEAVVENTAYDHRESKTMEF